jgi:hypothetical protein
LWSRTTKVQTPNPPVNRQITAISAFKKFKRTVGSNTFQIQFILLLFEICFSLSASQFYLFIHLKALKCVNFLKYLCFLEIKTKTHLLDLTFINFHMFLSLNILNSNLILNVNKNYIQFISKVCNCAFQSLLLSLIWKILTKFAFVCFSSGEIHPLSYMYYTDHVMQFYPIKYSTYDVTSRYLMLCIIQAQ